MFHLILLESFTFFVFALRTSMWLWSYPKAMSCDARPPRNTQTTNQPQTLHVTDWFGLPDWTQDSFDLLGINVSHQQRIPGTYLFPDTPWDWNIIYAHQLGWFWGERDCA